jgi:endonuclease/exonuclease/phosphatase family metal-dependent hydrolase
MNCRPSELAPLHEFLSPLDTPHATYPSTRPTKAFDQILYSAEWTLVKSATIRSLASDHLPLYADLELKAVSDAES